MCRIRPHFKKPTRPWALSWGVSAFAIYTTWELLLTTPHDLFSPLHPPSLPPSVCPFLSILHGVQSSHYRLWLTIPQSASVIIGWREDICSVRVPENLWLKVLKVTINKEFFFFFFLPTSLAAFDFIFLISLARPLTPHYF